MVKMKKTEKVAMTRRMAVFAPRAKTSKGFRGVRIDPERATKSMASFRGKHIGYFDMLV